MIEKAVPLKSEPYKESVESYLSRIENVVTELHISLNLMRAYSGERGYQYKRAVAKTEEIRELLKLMEKEL